MEGVILVLSTYLIIMNIAGFVMMGIDKRRAVRHEWRISEAALFMTAVLGGGIGCIFGMYTFRHKTKHWYFVIGMPAIVLVHIALAAAVLYYILTSKS